MTKLTNITHPNFRCSLGACPAVYISEDGKTFTIIGAIVGASQIGETKVGFSEEAIEISADLVLSSLGVSELVEAAKRARQELLWAAEQLDRQKRPDHAQDCRIAADALREALSRMKGGK